MEITTNGATAPTINILALLSSCRKYYQVGSKSVPQQPHFAVIVKIKQVVTRAMIVYQVSILDYRGKYSYVLYVVSFLFSGFFRSANVCNNFA